MNEIGPSYVTDLVSALPFIGDLSPTLQVLILALVALGLAGVATKVVTTVLGKLAEKTKTKADGIVIEHVEKPAIWVMFAALLYLALAPLVVPEGLASVLRSLLDTVFIVTVGVLVTKVSHALFEVWKETVSKKLSTVRDETLLPILSKFATGAIWVLTGIFILSAWNIDVTPFLAGLGIFGLAIGFGVRDSLNNIFGGISLALDKAYKVGDRIKLEDGTDGFVRDISLRSTRIETFDGDMIMVPNGKIANEQIQSYTQPTTVTRVTVPVGVGYGSDVEKVENLILDVLTNLEDVSTEKEPSVVFDKMADSAIVFKGFFWAEYPVAVKKKREATRKIYEELTREGVNIPYPTRTVYVKE